MAMINSEARKAKNQREAEAIWGSDDPYAWDEWYCRERASRRLVHNTNYVEDDIDYENDMDFEDREGEP